MQHGPAMHMGSASKQRAAYEIALKGKEQVAEGTYAFVFEKPEGFRFKAAQHVRVSLINPSETDAEGDKRFVTIASTPQDPDLVFAMRMRDTAFKRVLGRMQTGDKVLIEILLGESPPGSFVLHEDASRPAVFLVGGIGIVPAFSMIKDMTQRHLSHKTLLFYSNRRPEDAPFLKELQDLTEQNPSFKLIATMTKPENSAVAWRGETGSINRAMLNKYLDDLHAPIYYVAGLPEMVSAMQSVLAQVGVDEGSIRAEEFAGFTMAHADDAPNPRRKSHLLLGAIALGIMVIIALHVWGAVLILKGKPGTFSLKNPLLYLTIGLLLFVVAFKLKLHLRQRER